jgi:hypothetical protein
LVDDIFFELVNIVTSFLSHLHSPCEAKLRIFQGDFTIMQAACIRGRGPTYYFYKRNDRTLKSESLNKTPAIQYLCLL